jgi:hypothetical protein
MMEADLCDDFWSLSLALTGNAPADRRLAAVVMAGVARGREDQLEAVLAAWAERPADADPQQWIFANQWSSPEARRISQDIILSWVFGQVFKDGTAQATPAASQEELAALWFSGSFWTLAKAHAPGIPGGYFGHWSYPSEA